MMSKLTVLSQSTIRTFLMSQTILKLQLQAKIVKNEYELCPNFAYLQLLKNISGKLVKACSTVSLKMYKFKNKLPSHG